MIKGSWTIEYNEIIILRHWVPIMKAWHRIWHAHFIGSTRAALTHHWIYQPGLPIAVSMKPHAVFYYLGSTKSMMQLTSKTVKHVHVSVISLYTFPYSASDGPMLDIKPHVKCWAWSAMFAWRLRVVPELPWTTIKYERWPNTNTVYCGTILL